MLIPPEEAARFHTLYPSVIGFVSATLGGVDGVVDAETFREAPIQRQVRARDLLLETAGSSAPTLTRTPTLSRTGSRPCSRLEAVLRGRFIIERDLRPHTVFVTESDPPRAF